MPKKQQTGSKGGTKKYGRDVIKCQMYMNGKRRERNKLKRIRKSNGLVAAQKYAKLWGLKVPME